MTIAKPRIIVIPRVLTADQAGYRLNMSPNTFRKLLPELLAAGFPPFDELLQGYDRDAIEHWLDRRAGLPSTGGRAAGRDGDPVAAAITRDADELLALAGTEGPIGAGDGHDRDQVSSGDLQARRAQG